MFWDKGYTPSANIEALLEKENVTLEEFLDDEDILVECRSQKKSIVNYFTRPDVIKRLVELIITEPSEELPMAQRYRHANMACEILTLGLPSLDEKLLSDADTLKTLYSYLENEPPLNPLLSSFFSKTFSMLFTKKPEQDWFLYQQMCLQLLEYIKSRNNFLDLICKHFSTPVIPDLIMQMMKDVDGGQIKRNLYEWLTEDKLVERLIALLGNSQENDKHANVAEFLCDLIQQGRSMRQTEQENDSFEPAFDGSNPILKTIESEATIEALLNVILEPNAQESAIVSGISVVLTLIKPVVFVDEPTTDRLKFIHSREKEIHEQILGTVIRVIAPRLKDFNALLSNPPNKPTVVTTSAKLTPPFGMTRLKICSLFTVLLQTKNEDISKAICETDFFETILALFKQYCWNNFLHSEVEKCLQLIFYTQSSANNNNSTQGSTMVNDGFGFDKNSNGGDNASSFFDFVFKSSLGSNANEGGEGDGDGNNDGGGKSESAPGDPAASVVKTEPLNANESATVQEAAKEDEHVEKTSEECTPNTESPSEADEKMETEETETENAKCDATEDKEQQPGQKDSTVKEGDEAKEQDTSKAQIDTVPSDLQKHVIENCKLISKLIDCWKHNKDVESVEKGRRLGYMGHLIKIFKHITNCISESEHIGALIESNLSEAELELWQSIINPNDGDLTKALATQSKMLANCNAHEAGDYSQHLPKDFLSDNSTWDYIMSGNMINTLSAFGDSGTSDIVFALEMYRSNQLDNDDNAENDLHLFQFGRNIDDDDDEEDENNATGEGGHSLFGKSAASTSALQTFGVTNNPWDNLDPFTDITTNSNATPWAADFGSDNFADFDAHFSSFANDLGESLVSASKENENKKSTGTEREKNAAADNEEMVSQKFHKGYDNNANVEKHIDSILSQGLENNSKTSSATGKEVDDAVTEANKERALRNAVVRTLQSVMQDSEDDYEDDEGMWTKPLGSSAAQDNAPTVEESKQESTTESVQIPEKTLVNGPSKKDVVENENLKQLNKPNENITNPTLPTPAAIENDATPEIEISSSDSTTEDPEKAKDLNELAGDKQEVNKIDADAKIDDKLRAAILFEDDQDAITTT